MRTLSFLLALFAFGAILLVPSVAAPVGCTEIGTKDRDIMAGSPGKDKLCALGSGDYLHGAGKADVLLGMEGIDTIVGGAGRDILKGGEGTDRLFAVDQHRGDRLFGGPGQDRCYADKGDRVRGCEHVYRGNSPAVVQGLTGSFLGVSQLGEEAQASEAPPPVSDGGFPACTPPPEDPPDFC